MLFNNNNSIKCYSLVCLQLKDSKYSKWLNFSIWFIDEILMDTTTLGQNGPTSYGYEGALHILWSFKVGASPSDAG